MISRTSRQFWNLFDQLPDDVQKTARAYYRRFKLNPSHPSLHFKPISEPVWSIRAGIHYRALGIIKETERGKMIIWVWIGTHAAYDHMLRKL